MRKKACKKDPWLSPAIFQDKGCCYFYYFCYFPYSSRALNEEEGI
jgi:hypothetical protein